MSNLPPDQHGHYAPNPERETGDATGGIIPYKNVPALIAYYLGVFSCIPLLGVVSIILGVMGLVKAKNNPAVRGQVHAIIGIVLGFSTTIGWIVAIIFFSWVPW